MWCGMCDFAGHHAIVAAGRVKTEGLRVCTGWPCGFAGVISRLVGIDPVNFL